MPEARLNVVIDPTGAETGGRIVVKNIDYITAAAARMEAMQKQAAATMNGGFAAMSQGAQVMAAQIERSNAVLGRSVPAAAAASTAIKNLSTTARQARDPLSLASHELINLQYQLNDISVMLASGQNPFVMIMQQGMQIGQIFTARGTGLADSLKLVGSGFISFLLNPVNLGIFALASLAGAVSYLWSVLSGSDAKAAKDVLSDFNSSLSEITQQFEGAKKAVDFYMASIKNLSIAQGELMSQSESLEETLARSIESIRERFAVAQMSNAPSVAAGGMAMPVMPFQQISDLISEMQKGAITVEQFRVKIQEIRLDETATDSVRSLAKELFDASKETSLLEQALNKAAAAASGLNSKLEPTWEQKIEAGKQQNTTLAKYFPPAPVKEVKLTPDWESQVELGKLQNDTMAKYFPDGIVGLKPPKAETTRRSGSSPKSEEQKLRESNANTILREQEAINRLIEDLRIEQTLIGATNLEKEQSIAVANMGLSATDEQIAKVEELIETIYNQKKAVEDLQSAQDFLAESTADAMMSLIDGSKSAREAVADLLKTLASAFLQSALLGQGPLAGILGSSSTNGGVGGIFGALFGNVAVGHTGGMVGSLGQSRSVPMSMFANAPRFHNGTLAPDERPIIAQTGEMILSRQDVANARSGGQSMNFNINVSGANGDAEVERRAYEGAKKAIREYDRSSYSRHISNGKLAKKQGVVL